MVELLNALPVSAARNEPPVEQSKKIVTNVEGLSDPTRREKKAAHPAQRTIQAPTTTGDTIDVTFGPLTPDALEGAELIQKGDGIPLQPNKEKPPLPARPDTYLGQNLRYMDQHPVLRDTVLTTLVGAVAAAPLIIPVVNGYADRSQPPSPPSVTDVSPNPMPDNDQAITQLEPQQLFYDAQPTGPSIIRGNETIDRIVQDTLVRSMHAESLSNEGLYEFVTDLTKSYNTKDNFVEGDVCQILNKHDINLVTELYLNGKQYQASVIDLLDAYRNPTNTKATKSQAIEAMRKLLEAIRLVKPANANTKINELRQKEYRKEKGKLYAHIGDKNLGIPDEQIVIPIT